ncbi:hypothetical protein CBL_05693 [Carabus blaptoides fortunei]
MCGRVDYGVLQGRYTYPIALLRCTGLQLKLPFAHESVAGLRNPVEVVCLFGCICYVLYLIAEGNVVELFGAGTLWIFIHKLILLFSAQYFIEIKSLGNAMMVVTMVEY